MAQMTHLWSDQTLLSGSSQRITSTLAFSWLKNVSYPSVKNNPLSITQVSVGER